MSANLELVRSVYAALERGDFGLAEWAHPQIEFVITDGPDPGSWKGRADMARVAREHLGVWEGYRIKADEYRELDDERVLVLVHRTGRGKTSGLQAEQIGSNGAQLLQVRGGKVTRYVTWFDRDRAFADLGLEGEAVSGESTTPDLVARTRDIGDAWNSGDLDAVLSFFAANATFEEEGLGTHEGVAAIRDRLSDWLDVFEGSENVVEEVLDLGNGVTFAVAVMRGRPAGSAAQLRQHWAVALVWTDGTIERFIPSPDIDEARAAAERLARGRGLRAINAWNRQDLPAFLETWDEKAEWRPAFPAGTEGSGAVFRGREEIARAWRGVREAWSEYRVDVHEARMVGDTQLILGRIHARGAHSDIEINSEWSAVVRVRGGKAISAWDWLDHDHALKAVGLKE
jgi:ketosteroid isomerase-like protein